jgi:hypothetical protein
VDQRGALCGLGAGLLGNLLLARAAPQVSWLWWNPAGFLVATFAALLLARAPLRVRWPAWPRREAALLVGAFLLMLGLLAALPG